MGWDIFVQDLPPLAQSVEDIPDDFEPGCIGQRTNIIARIKQIAPSADFSDPAWGEINAEDYWIDINIGDHEDVYGVAFHVRGGDGAAIVIILSGIDEKELGAIGALRSPLRRLQAATCHERCGSLVNHLVVH